MPLEIEIKIKLDTHDAVRGKLAAVGAERVGRVRETNIFFDRPDGGLRKADSGLRVRLTADVGGASKEALLTFKGPAAGTGLRSREAFDVRTQPAEQVVPLVEALGFVREFTFEKDRESWRVDGCLVELDTLPVFGCFLEIEGPSEEAVGAVQGKLGLAGEAAHRESYAKMVGGWLKERGLRELRFGGVE